MKESKIFLIPLNINKINQMNKIHTNSSHLCYMCNEFHLSYHMNKLKITNSNFANK